MKFLATGGAGFIGFHIVEELPRRGQTYASSTTPESLSFASGRNELEVVEGDIRDIAIVDSALCRRHFPDSERTGLLSGVRIA